MATLRFSDFYLHARKARHIIYTFDLPFDGLEALLLFNDWKQVTGRTFGNIQHIAGWSGQHPRWKKRIRKGIGIAIQSQVIGTKQSGKGTSLYITEKGKKVLQAYDDREKGIIEEQEIKRDAIQAKRKRPVRSVI